MSNIAIVNYYARLINKGRYTIDQVPEEDKQAVKDALQTLKKPEFDPVTETPELTEENDVKVPENIE
jgi:hypothetical protein